MNDVTNNLFEHIRHRLPDKYNIGDKLPVVIMVDEENNEIKRLIGEKSKEDIINFIKD